MDELVSVPLLAMRFEMPVDGFPLYHSWLSTCKGIYMSGFESHREIMEVKWANGQGCVPDGSPISFSSVEAVKGIGRVSIILFGVVWTYLNKEQLD